MLPTATTSVAASGKTGSWIGCAFDRAPARPVGLDEHHVGERGEGRHVGWLDAAYAAFGERPAAGHDPRGRRLERVLDLRAQFLPASSEVTSGPTLSASLTNILVVGAVRGPSYRPRLARRRLEDRARLASRAHESGHITRGDAKCHVQLQNDSFPPRTPLATPPTHITSREQLARFMLYWLLQIWRRMWTVVERGEITGRRGEGN